jgi:uncharacterized protein
MTRTAAWLAVLAGTASPVAAQEVSPSFDCRKASGEVEELICSDEGLAALDRELAGVYDAAMNALPAEELASLKTYQRGWVKGRNDCWKAEDVRDCVAYSYRTRMLELQIQSGQLEAPTPVGYSCEGREGTPVFAAFYRDSDPPSVVLTVGDDQAIAFIAPSGSGARYTAPNVELWEHHGEATLDWFGTRLSCTPQ